MDYEYSQEKAISLDPASKRALSTLQKSIEEIIKRLSKIEQRLEEIKSE
jgi:hypothetical protein